MVHDDDDPDVDKTTIGPPPPAPPPVHGSVWDGNRTSSEVLALGEGQKVSLEIAAGPWAILRKLEAAQTPGPLSLVAAGWLDAISIADVLSLVQTIKLDGELICDFDECVKTVHFERGNIVHASSTLADDRLADLLLARGRILRDAYAQITRVTAPGEKRAGRMLVDSGILSEPQLYDALIDQVENIVISLFGYTKGQFVFSAKPLEVENPLRLTRPMMYYILEGSRRRDELDEALTDVADREAVFAPTGKEPEGTADGASPGIEQDVLALVDGTARVWQVIARSTWSETNTRLALARLLRNDMIAAVRQKPEPPKKAGVTFSASPATIDKSMATAERFNTFFRAAQKVINSSEIDPECFQLFLAGRSSAVRGIFDGAAREDGSIHSPRLVGNLTALHLPEAEAFTLLRSALEDAVEFCVWLLREKAGEEESKRIGDLARILLREQ